MRMRSAGAYGIPAEDLLFVRAGDSIAVGGITIDVLAPAAADRETYQKILEDSEDENELCLIVKAKCRGTEVLFTGDIGAEYEKKLTSLYGNGLAADILKVAHHGSRYSTWQSVFVGRIAFLRCDTGRDELLRTSFRRNSRPSGRFRDADLSKRPGRRGLFRSEIRRKSHFDEPDAARFLSGIVRRTGKSM